MRRVAIAATIVAAVALGLAVSHGQILLSFLGLRPPATAFDPAMAPPAPDYSQRSSWASLPDMTSPSDVTPPGVPTGDPATAPADIFFIYPTSFFSASHWNAAIDDARTNARTDLGSLCAQASAFNLCCRIYVPRYRQMTFGGFVHWSGNSSKALSLAYSDVRAAFEYYVAHYNHGRPFIIAAHSQGSRLASRLVPELIDHTKLMKQFVAAYIIGTWLPEGWFAAMRDVKPCEHADDTGCVVTWSTLLEGSDADAARRDFELRSGNPASFGEQRFVCINPLNWSRGDALAPASLDDGGWIPGRGRRVAPIVPHLVSARCDDGALFVSRPPLWQFRIAAMPGGNYHNYDYQLAWTNIRENAQARARAFMAHGR